jgi:RNA polymerase sigma-70 factor (sigma-E family)
VNASDRPGRPGRPAAGEAGFEAFFERHHRELSRLAYLLTGDHGAADDLTGDAFLAVWRQWDRVRDRDEPLAYVRRIVVNMAASRIRRLIRERRRERLIEAGAPRVTSGPDGAAVLDVRAALQRLPVRRRACVVLRHAFDLSEQDVARLLGISVGTVKSQTAKGVAQLQALLADAPDPPVLRELSERWTA